MRSFIRSQVDINIMDVRQAVLGLVLFVVFWGFQNNYAAPLGSAAWLAGSIVFVVILWLIGSGMMPKPPQEVKELWMLATSFLILSTFAISFLGPYLGAVLPSSPAQLTPLVLSFWLVVYGAAMFVMGMQGKMNVSALIGVIWLFSALHFVTAVGTGPNSYLHFGLVTGLPFILAGLMAKK